MNNLIYAFIAFCFSIIMIMIFIPLSHKIGLTDKPNTQLKTHKKPIPQIGGIILFIIIICFYAFSLTSGKQMFSWEILLSFCLIFILGIIDDIKRLSPLPKIIVQSLIAVFLISRGIVIEVASFPFIINAIITFIWITGIMNAFNLMDIMDGLAGGIGLIIALTLIFINISGFYNSPILLLSIITGFLAAFLIFNKPDARIYLGDSGSLLLGLMLAVLSINTRYTSVNNIAYLTPILIFGIPIFDTAYVTFARISRGKNPLHGSADHFVLRMKAIIARNGFIVFVMILLQAVLSLLAFISTIVNIFWAFVIYGFTVIVLIRIGFYIFRLNNEK